LSFFLVIIFLFLLISAYRYHKTVLETSVLIDASSAIANGLATDNLAYIQGMRKRCYVIDPAKIRELSWEVSLGSENFQFNIKLAYWRSGQKIEIEAGPQKPNDKQISVTSLPIAVFDNFRLEAGSLEVRTWRK
ncbi:MAG: hypothetical protein QXW92_04875, partial [Candidatus Hadarchaeales archaeon]